MFDKKANLDLKNAAMVVRSINNQKRKAILNLINEKQPIAVSEIYTTLRMEQSVVSNHLGILRKEGIVNGNREGKYIYYSINKSKFEKVMGIIERLSAA